MKLTRHEHNRRIQETIDALCANSTMQAQTLMRERYHWSRSTWFNYQRAALARLVATQPCLEEARTKRIEQIERLVADPSCNHAARARYLDQLNKLQGAYAPERVDARVLTADQDFQTLLQAAIRQEAARGALQAPPAHVASLLPAQVPLGAPAPQNASQGPPGASCSASRAGYG